MKSIPEIQEEIVEEFGFFDDWMDKYEHLIELGKSLPLIKDEFKNEDHLIKGCQSQVWLQAEEQNARVIFSADSDAIITKGLIALMIRVLSGQSAADIAEADMGFLDEIGLKEHLSPTRANGLNAMVKQMKYYALAMMAR